MTPAITPGAGAPLPIPDVPLPAMVQQLRMILDPIGFLQLCFRENPGMRRARFPWSVAPGMTAPGELNELLTQLVGQRSILLLSGAAHHRRRQLLTLLFAGHETTATALAWALYWIHSLPEVQAALRAELASLEGDSDPERIARLPCLTAVCQETLRIHPVAMLLFPRRVEESLRLGAYRLEPGEVVMDCIQAVHQRHDLYPEPGRFRPERFLERAFGPTEFLPFGGGGASLHRRRPGPLRDEAGAGHCAGGWQLERADSRTLVPRRRGFTLAPSGPLWLRHRPR
jgi:cytochrome P450